MVRIGSVELGEFPLLLAPMEDVSDPPFRTLCKKHGADMMYTEFISSEGLIRDAVMPSLPAWCTSALASSSICGCVRVCCRRE